MTDTLTVRDALQMRFVPAGELHLRAGDETADGIPFEGYAAVFDQRTWIGAPDRSFGFWEELAPSAFNKTLGDGAQRVKMILNHDSTLLLASVRAGTMSLTTDDFGLKVNAEMAPTSYGRDLQISLQRGDLDGMSFGFFPIKEERISLDDGDTLYRVNEAALVEVSPTGFPAYVGTEAAARSALLRELAAIPEPERAELLAEFTLPVVDPPALRAGEGDELIEPSEVGTRELAADAMRRHTARAIAERHRLHP